MRRALVAALIGVALVGLTACSGHGPSYPGNTTLQVTSPDLVALKQQSQVPDCPKVSGGAVDGGMPAVTVDCLGGGRSVDLAGLRGPLIVNFWQAYCGPCRQEMPALAAFARRQSTVRVLGIDYLDMQPAAALKLARDSHVAYPLVADPAGNLAGRAPLPRNPGLPFTAFVDATGRIVHIEAGAYDDEQAVATAARQYLGTSG